MPKKRKLNTPKRTVGGVVYDTSYTKRFNGNQYRLNGYRPDGRFTLHNTRKSASKTARAMRSSLHGNDAARVVKVKDKFVVYVHRKGGWSMF